VLYLERESSSGPAEKRKALRARIKKWVSAISLVRQGDKEGRRSNHRHDGGVVFQEQRRAGPNAACILTQEKKREQKGGQEHSSAFQGEKNT